LIKRYKNVAACARIYWVKAVFYRRLTDFSSDTMPLLQFGWDAVDSHSTLS